MSPPLNPLVNSIDELRSDDKERKSDNACSRMLSILSAVFESHLKDPVKTIITVEQNSGAQFGHLLKEQTGISYTHAILKYDGRPFYPIEIMDAVKEKEKH